jgi:succinate dehydrogenase / fumarate reductase membrane anchor subunit
MVTAVTSFTRSGVADWLVQRVSAVILLAFFGYLAYLFAGGLDYPGWAELFERTWMKIFTLLALLSLVAHAWIGMWGVLTDYLTERLLGPKGNVLRIGAQLLIALSLVIYAIWGVQVIWG